MAHETHVCDLPKPDWKGDEAECPDCGAKYWAGFAGRDDDGDELLSWQPFESDKPPSTFERWTSERRDPGEV